MSELTLEQITRLLDINASARTVSSDRWFDGTEWHNGKPRNSGSFQGKSGSIRRNAKGRTRRMPDGKRKYIVEGGTTNVVAYISRP